MVTFVAYLAASQLMLSAGEPVSFGGAVFWPGAGVAVVALLLSPTRWWPALLVSVAAAELVSGTMVSETLGSPWWVLANVATAGVTAAVARALDADRMTSVRALVWFNVATVLGSAVGGAVATVELASHPAAVGSFDAALRWASSDGLGILTIAPVALMLTDARCRRSLLRVEAGLALAASVAVALFAFTFAPRGVALPYLVLLPMLWAALRIGPAAAAASVFAVGQVANLTILMMETSPILPVAQQPDAVWRMQLFLVVISFTVLVIGSRTLESDGHLQRARSQQVALDVSRTLEQLGRAALAANDPDELEHQAREILEPLLGESAAGAIAARGPAAAELEAGTPDWARDAATLLDIAYSRLAAKRALQAANARTDESDQFARLLLNSTGDGLYGVDRDGRCTFANHQALDLLGYDNERDLLGESMHDLVHHTRPDGTPYPAEACSISRSEEVWSDDELLFRADGTSFPAAVRSRPIWRDGELIGSVLTFRDISDQVHAQGELDRSLALQRIAGSMARLGGWSLDVRTDLFTVTDEVLAIIERDDRGPTPFGAALGPYTDTSREELRTAIRRCASDGTPFELEVQLQTRTGRQIWARTIGEARFGDDGSVTHVFGAFQDITEMKAASEKARDLSQQLTSTLESITDAFYTLDHDWRFTYVNRRAELLLRRPREELLGRVVWDEFPTFERSDAGSLLRKARETGVTSTLEDFYFEPLDCWFEIHAYPTPLGLAVYFRDTSVDLQTRRELQHQRAQLEQQAALLDKARDAITVRDLGHRITYWNRSAEELYGWAAAEALGHRSDDLLYADASGFELATAEVLEHGEWSGELQQVTKDGTPIVVEGRWTLVRDDDGTPTSILAINSDVTDRKIVEQQLFRAQRMESIGTLAGGIAHDLNNMLAPILLSVQTLQMRPSDPATQNAYTIIERSATRGAEMVRQVLSFARGVEGQRVEIDPKDLLSEVFSIVSDTFPKSITMTCEPSDGLWPVQGDVTQLHQVVMNLCLNARDAMPDGGSLRMSARNMTVDGHYTALDQEGAPGPYVVIRVEDDGEGMDADTVTRVFDPFFSTKVRTGGTGLGLSTSRGIIRSHGGFFQVYSEPGVGTTFEVYLPTSAAGKAAADELALPEVPTGDGQLILVVDDETTALETVRGTLETFGYRVLTAQDGTEAVPLFDEHAHEVDAVLTDMMMPNMDGAATVAALRERAPSLPIVVASGLVDDRAAGRVTSMGVRHFLAKPYGARELLSVLDDVFERTRR